MQLDSFRCVIVSCIINSAQAQHLQRQNIGILRDRILKLWTMLRAYHVEREPPFCLDLSTREDRKQPTLPVNPPGANGTRTAYYCTEILAAQPFRDTSEQVTDHELKDAKRAWKRCCISSRGGHAGHSRVRSATETRSLHTAWLISIIRPKLHVIRQEDWSRTTGDKLCAGSHHLRTLISFFAILFSFCNYYGIIVIIIVYYVRWAGTLQRTTNWTRFLSFYNKTKDNIEAAP